MKWIRNPESIKTSWKKSQLNTKKMTTAITINGVTTEFSKKEMDLIWDALSYRCHYGPDFSYKKGKMFLKITKVFHDEREYLESKGE